MQKALIDEEWSEFHEAYHMKDDCDQLKELADLVYVCYQFAASQEWDLDEAMRRVHESNMSKLDEYGKPIYRADGKVLKGPNYKEPYISRSDYRMTTSIISRTGRVQSWMDDPTSRLPVSCTVFVVQDSMEGPDGIEASWRFVSHALRFGAGCAVHLSELRPKGAENGKGLVASGPVSFAKNLLDTK